MAVLLPWRGEKRVAVSTDFDHALTQEILRTELIRIKALIGTAALLGAILWTIYIFEPEVVSRVWMGHLKPSYLYSILVPFILFELWVHAMISRHIRLRLETLPPEVQAIGWKAQVRLCKRYRQLTARGKHVNQVVVAIAREMAAFAWAIARIVPLAS